MTTLSVEVEAGRPGWNLLIRPACHCFGVRGEAVPMKGQCTVALLLRGLRSSGTVQPLPHAAQAEKLASRMPSGCGFLIVAGNPWPDGGVAGLGAALGETPVDGEVSITGLTSGPQANIAQLPTTGASRWSSPGHPIGTENMNRKQPANPATWETVQEIARALPGAVEGTSYGTPAFHVSK